MASFGSHIHRTLATIHIVPVVSQQISLLAWFPLKPASVQLENLSHIYFMLKKSVYIILDKYRAHIDERRWQLHE